MHKNILTHSKLKIVIFILTVFFSTNSHAHYTATIVKVVDGDTLKLDVKIWPGITSRVNLRLRFIDTPEKGGVRNGKPIPECEKKIASVAIKYVKELLPVGKKIFISSVKKGKYSGRVLGLANIEGESLSKILIRKGYARKYSGGTRSGWCK